MTYRAVVIGFSAGGLNAVKVVLPALPMAFPAAVIIVRHVAEQTECDLPRLLRDRCLLPLRPAEEKELIHPGVVYVAPPGYHLLVESDRSFSLSVDEPVNYSRPSIDVLFETAAEAYGSELIGVVLTGANRDGSAGLKRIKELGGCAVVQDPATAEAELMPESAIEAAAVDHIVDIMEIGPLLAELCTRDDNSSRSTGGNQ